MRVGGIILFLFCFLSPILTFAEVIPISIPQSYTGYNPVGIVRNTEGFILAGNTQNPETGWDVSLLWLTDEYSLIKHHELRGNRSDIISKIIGVEGHFILLTNTASHSGDLIAEKGTFDINITKMDQEGHVVQTKTLGGSGINYAQDISVCMDEKAISVLGWLDSPGLDIVNIRGGWDIFVSKYSFRGERLWAKTLGSIEDDLSGSIVCVNGKVYIVFNSWNSERRWDLQFVSLDDIGNTIVKKSYGGMGSDIANKIIKTEDDDFIILGTSESRESEMGSFKGKSDILIMKINESGEIIWTTRLGGSANDIAHDIEIGHDGFYWVLGLTESNDGDIKSHIGGWDICIFKIDEKGNLLLSETYGTLNDEQPLDILAMENSILFLAGTKLSNIFTKPLLIKKDY